MTQIAEVSVAIRAELDKYERELQGAKVATERFDRSAGNSMRNVDRQTKNLTQSTNLLKGAFLGLLSVVGLNAIQKLSDDYTSLTNKLRVIAGEQGNVNQMLEDLNGIASRTRAPLEATATLYQRVSMNARELGASNKEVLRFTENVGLALAQQGGSAASASGALLQLSQAMGAGVVRAEEFNSILEGAFPIAQAAARGLDEAGGSVARLRGLIIEGKVTSEEFFQAILSQTDSLNAAFASTVPTIGGAMSRARDSLMLLVGALNDSTGASTSLAQAFIAMSNAFGQAADWVRENGDTIKTVMNTVVGSALVYGTAMMVKFGLAALTAGGQVSILVGTLGLLKTAIISTGIGVLVVGAGYLIGKFIELTSAVGGFGNAMVYLKELGLEVWERLQLGGAALVEGYKAYTAGFVLLWQEAFAGVLKLFGQFIDQILDGTRNAMLGAGNIAAAAAIEASRAAIKASLGQMQEGAQAAVDAQKVLVSEHFKNAQQMAKDAIAPLEMWKALNDVIDAARQKAAGSSSGAAAPPIPDLPDIGETNEKAEKLNKTLERQINELERLRVARNLFGDEGFYKVRDQIEAENEVRATGVDLMSKEGQALLELVKQRNAAADELERRLNTGGGPDPADRERAQSRLDDLRSKMIARNVDALEQLRRQKEEELSIIKEAEKNRVILETEAAEQRSAIKKHYQQAEIQLMLSSAEVGFGALANIIGAAAGETSAAYKVLFGISKGFAIAQSTIAMFQSIAEASKTPFPANIALMAQAATQGAAIVSNITSLQPKGFMTGGYTGDIGPSNVAGVVHGNEFVMDAAKTRVYRPVLEAMHNGSFDPSGMGGGRQLKVNVINQAPGVTHDVQQIDENTVRIIARQEAARVAPGSVASAMRDPNSEVSKSLNQSVAAPRRR